MHTVPVNTPPHNPNDSVHHDEYPSPSDLNDVHTMSHNPTCLSRPLAQSTPNSQHARDPVPKHDSSSDATMSSDTGQSPSLTPPMSEQPPCKKIDATVVKGTKTLKCHQCGVYFTRGTHLRGPHPGHRSTCPRHPDHYRRPPQDQSKHDHDTVDGPLPEDGEDPLEGPSSKTPARHDDSVVDSEADDDDDVLLRNGAFLLRQIQAKTWNNVLKNVTYKVYFKDDVIGDQVLSALKILRAIFEAILDAFRADLRSQDLFRVYINAPGMAVPIIYHIREWSEVRVEDILDTIVEQLQSNKDILLDHSFEIHIGVFQVPRGGGNRNDCLRVNGDYEGLDRCMKWKKGVIYIKNNDKSCLSRAIVATWLHTIRTSDDEYRDRYGEEHRRTKLNTRLERALQHGACTGSLYKYVTEKEHSMKAAAKWLTDKCGLDFDIEGSLSDIRAYETVLRFKIHCLQVGDAYTFLTEPAEQFDVRPQLFILYNRKSATDGHYHGVRWIDSLFGRSRFCQLCFRPYSVTHIHTCREACGRCGRKPLTPSDVEAALDTGCIDKDTNVHVKYCIEPDDTETLFIRCTDCNGVFNTTECFKAHKSLLYDADVSNDPPDGTHGECVDEVTPETVDINDKEKKTRCSFFIYCADVCKKRYRRDDYLDFASHRCFDFRCRKCHCLVNENHECYLRSRPIPKNQKDAVYCFYDFEVSQDMPQSCGNFKAVPRPGCVLCTGAYVCKRCRTCVHCRRPYCGVDADNAPGMLHRPVFVSALMMCTRCFDSSDITGTIARVKCAQCGTKCEKCTRRKKPCMTTESCGIRQHRFEGLDCLNEFGKWLFHERHVDVYAIAHNAAGYDNYFMLDYLLETGQTPYVLYKGAKIMKIVQKAYNIRLLDSYLFMSMPLSALPKTFGMEHVVRKGYFAHFHTRTNSLNYIGAWPPMDSYGYNEMSSEKRQDFITWYNDITVNQPVYDHMHELRTYCDNDVLILALCSLAYTCMMLELRNIAPFTVATTLASLVMAQYRMYDLRECYKLYMKDGRVLPEVYRRGGQYYTQTTDVPHIKTPIDKKDVKKSIFLKSDIAFLPRGRLAGVSGQYSKAAMEWLKYRESLQPPGSEPMITALSGSGEKTLPGSRFRVDGYLKDAKIFLDFHGE